MVLYNNRIYISIYFYTKYSIYTSIYRIYRSINKGIYRSIHKEIYRIIQKYM